MCFGLLPFTDGKIQQGRFIKLTLQISQDRDGPEARREVGDGFVKGSLGLLWLLCLARRQRGENRHVGRKAVPPALELQVNTRVEIGAFDPCAEPRPTP